jgi:hypothetical protein
LLPDLIPQGARKVLPAGEHLATWIELKARFGTGSLKRKKLLSSILEVARMLRNAGCAALYIDGSFVSDKKIPGDWDGCFCTGGLDWSRTDPLLRDVLANRAAIAAQYRADLFPADCLEASSGLTFLDFFQRDSKGRPKGIIVLDLRTIP